jgi:Lrp/AsnC family transcriptional regulator, leucine-responsive regulatory protein
VRTIDETDVQILQLLQADGRMPNATLADKIGLTPPSTAYRVKALEKAGLIKGYHALVDHERLGLKLMVLCQVQLSLHQEQPIERFRRAVSDIPEVLECLHVSGQFDFQLKIVVRDMKHYEGLIREKITKIKGIEHINSSFVMAAPKMTTQVPL